MREDETVTTPIERVRSARRRFCVVIVCVACLLAGAWSYAQVSPEEHAKHHPGATPPATQPAATSGSGGMGGMSGMMEMMEGMHAPPQKELYPSLMSLPKLTPEKNAELSTLAHERMKAGTTLMSQGLEGLADTAAGNDFAAMQSATNQVREGLDQFNSGLAAHRAIAEGKAPREVALEWFKDQMDLGQPAVALPGRSGPMGLSWLHFWVMAALVIFTAAMLWMYFFKMRRASLLLQGITVGGVQLGSVPTDVASKQSSMSAPPSNSWAGKLRVGRIFQETPDVKTFRLMNPLGGVMPFSYLPGQFLTVTVRGADGRPAKRSYTIASSPTQHDYAELTVKHQLGGTVSAFLDSQVKEGDLLECSGPAGSFIFTGRECKCILLIGAGVGITPLMSVARYLLDRSWAGDIFLVCSCRTPKDIIFKEELEYLQHRHANLRVVVTISRPEGSEWTGATGRITKELITANVPDIGSRYVHICGPVPMMECTKHILA